jgi:beta-alanine--pyruvate transaminase
VRCFQKGLLVRIAGDILAFSPPLIIEEEQIAEIFRTVGEVLKEVD